MDKYRKIRKLGEGGFGAAWLIQRIADSEHFVAKVVPTSALNAEERKEALREAQMLQSLSHPNIVTYVESFNHAGSLHIVMEYCDGGDLFQRIQSKRKANNSFSEMELWNVFIQICLALKYLHDKRILHRDLKSQNVFLTSRGVVKLGDFGIAKALAHTADYARTQIGTPFYLSPEICQNKPYDRKSDVWALGCILYEMAALHVPFTGNDLPAVLQRIMYSPTPAVPSRYDKSVSSLVQGMLKKQPKERPTINQVIRSDPVQRRIRLLVQDAPAAAPERGAASASPSPSQSPAVQPRRRSPSPAAAAARPPVAAAPAAAAAAAGQRAPMRAAPVVRVHARDAAAHRSPARDLPPQGASAVADAERRLSEARRAERDAHEEALARARREAYEERMALRRKMADAGGRPASRDSSPAPVQASEASPAARRAAPSARRSDAGAEGKGESYEEALARARRETYEERLALQQRMAAVGGRPGSRGSAPYFTEADAAPAARHRAFNEEKRESYEEALARARREAFEERQALQLKMAAVGGRPNPARGGGAAAPSGYQRPQAPYATVSSDEDDRAPARRVADQRRAEQAAHEEALARARREAFEERMALQRKMADAGGRPALAAGSDPAAASVADDARMGSDARRRAAQERSARARESHEEALARARLEAFEERQALQRKMAGAGGRPPAEGDRSAASDAAGGAPYALHAGAAPEPPSGARRGSRGGAAAESKGGSYEEALARARRETFEERMALQRKMARAAAETSEAGAGAARARSGSEGLETTRMSPGANDEAAGRRMSVFEQRNRRKEEERAAHEAALARARREAFEERMALQRKMADAGGRPASREGTAATPPLEPEGAADDAEGMVVAGDDAAAYVLDDDALLTGALATRLSMEASQDWAEPDGAADVVEDDVAAAESALERARREALEDAADSVYDVTGTGQMTGTPAGVAVSVDEIRRALMMAHQQDAAEVSDEWEEEDDGATAALADTHLAPLPTMPAVAAPSEATPHTIEGLRVYLEAKLGYDLLVDAYMAQKEVETGERSEEDLWRMVPAEQQKYLALVCDLIAMENAQF